MGTLTITGKGQITLRKDLLRHLGVQPGDRIEVDMLPDGAVALRAAPPKGKIAQVFNMLRRPQATRLSIEEIGGIAARGWSGKR
jgi:bifunctional DNA-binding transcriptional regulator/antitoxin component of YhaV-PrlF toxin-antitoxin module